MDIWASGVTLFCFLFAKTPWHSVNILELHNMIREAPIMLQREPPISADVQDLLEKILVRDTKKRITVQKIRKHAWISRLNTDPLPSEELNCQFIEVTAADISHAGDSQLSIRTIVMILFILKRKSFKNLFISHPVSLRDLPQGESAKIFYPHIPSLLKNPARARLNSFSLMEPVSPNAPTLPLKDVNMDASVKLLRQVSSKSVVVVDLHTQNIQKPDPEGEMGYIPNGALSPSHLRIYRAGSSSLLKRSDSRWGLI